MGAVPPQEVGGGPVFDPVAREPSLTDKVASRLLDTILTQRLRPGDRLPSERQLGEQFGVSRTVVREAVRSLVAKGVLDVRSGRGLQVARVDGTLVSETVQLYLREHDLDYWQIHEVREIIEIKMAQLACERGTDEDFAKLRSICASMEDVLDDREEASIRDVRFHIAIAEATHNPLYKIMLDSMGGVLLNVRRYAAGVSRVALDRAFEQHNRILERIAERDADGAREAMRAHLLQVKEFWLEEPPTAASAPGDRRATGSHAVRSV